MSAHHLFLSYSRKDNKAPVNAAGEGWVTAFVAELKRPHADYSGRELRGLRLLHPALEVEVDDRGVERPPGAVRLHRLVARHVAGNGLAHHFADLDRFLDELTTAFEQRVGHSEDTALRVQHPWHRDQLEFLVHLPASSPPFSSHPPPLCCVPPVSFLLTAQRAQAAGKEELAAQCFAACRGVLEELITAGCQLDPPMMNLYAQLKRMVSPS